MRYLKQIAHPGFVIGLYAWNNKFILKIEAGPYEQTYKVSELDVSTAEEAEALLDEPFMTAVQARFRQMDADWQQAQARAEARF
jgi:hypothetical protein